MISATIALTFAVPPEWRPDPTVLQGLYLMVGAYAAGQSAVDWQERRGASPPEYR